MPGTHRSARHPVRGRVVGAVAVAALLVAMGLNTSFLTADEVAALGPEEFDPVQTGDELWTRAQGELDPQPLADVVTAVQADPAAAAEEFGAAQPTDSAYVFAVELEGTVTEADADSLRVQVDGVPEETSVIVPVGAAVNGAVLRDALGFRFADAPGQTEYQFVGDELKKKILAEVAESVPEPAETQDGTVSVTGVLGVQVTGDQPPAVAKPVNVQPVQIEVVS